MSSEEFLAVETPDSDSTRSPRILRRTGIQSDVVQLLSAAVAGATIVVLSVVGIAVYTKSPSAPVDGCIGFDRCPSYPLPYAFGQWPKTYDYSGSFPPGFVWGFGTASYQVEGGYKEGGRGVSIWDTFTGANTIGMPGNNCSYCCTQAPCPVHPKMADKGATGNVACDSYHMYKTDIALMKSMRLKHYRFSIAWPRIFPTGAASGPPNPEGVKFYSAFIDELLAADIEPYVTLYHWDLPQALLSPPDIGGWWARDASGHPSKQILPNWLHYVDTCFALFGNRVKRWVTFNEAWTFTFLTSGLGKAPSIPEYSDQLIDPYIAAHNVLNAHAAAVHLYRSKYKALQGGLIGITNNVDWREPKTPNSADVASSERAVLFGLGWFTDPIFGNHGDYPPEMRRLYGTRLPEFTAEERNLLKGSADFFGLNHYGTGWVSFHPEPGADNGYAAMSTEGFPRAQSGWLYGSGWGFRKLLNWIKRRYNNPIIYVTEGGWSTAASTAEEAAKDKQRKMYYANYTAEMLKAIKEDGVDVRGYFAWSLLDNFEWERGYIERFGTVFTDYNFGFDPDAAMNSMHQPTPFRQMRRRKDSNCWLERLWTSNSLVNPEGYFCVDSSIFKGRYTDPKHVGCFREISVDSDGLTGTIKGSNQGAGLLACDMINDKPWGPIPVKFSGGTIIANFSVSGGPEFLEGFWTKDTAEIHWGDGNHWNQVA